MTHSPIDNHGNLHDENGRFVSLRDYIEDILKEDREQHSANHEREHAVAKETAQRLERGVEASALRIEDAVKTALKAVSETARIHSEAHDKEHGAHERIHNVEKTQVDKAATQLLTRLEKLELGGAPFASRLDDSMLSLKADVAELKENMVRTGVLDDLTSRAIEDAKTQKRQLMYIAIGAGLSFMFSIILAVTRVSW